MLAADLQIHKIRINKVKKKLPFALVYTSLAIITMTTFALSSYFYKNTNSKAKVEARVPRLKIFRSEKSSLMINISKL
jgi:hypothetical protein